MGRYVGLLFISLAAISGCGGGADAPTLLEIFPTSAVPTGSGPTTGSPSVPTGSGPTTGSPSVPTGAGMVNEIPSTTNVFTMPANYLVNVALDQEYRSRFGTRAFGAVIVTPDQATADGVVETLILTNEESPEISPSNLQVVAHVFRFDYSGTLSGGRAVFGKANGAFYSRPGALPPEFISLNTVNIDGAEAFSTDGTSPSGTTPTSASYVGDAVFSKFNPLSGDTVSESGTFQMSVDFRAGTANVRASATNAALTATATGVNDIFSAILGTGEITYAGRVSEPANLLLYFSGVDGGGVHGAVVEAPSSEPDFVVVNFLGTKN